MKKQLKRSNLEEVAPYITKDGSEIRELMHPDIHGNRHQSLALATVAPGSSTSLHHHLDSEEIYYIVSGTGLLKLDQELITVTAGDAICIEPGMKHCISNTGTENLQILCSCAPAYRHDDTIVDVEH